MCSAAIVSTARMQIGCCRGPSSGTQSHARGGHAIGAVATGLFEVA